jgi:hypothetical protein
MPSPASHPQHHRRSAALHVALLCASMLAIACLVTVDASSNRVANSYIAAAVQMTPFYSPSVSPSRIVQRNVADYEALVRQAADKQANIIVFPEGSNGWMGAVGRDRVFERNQALGFGELIPHVDNGVPGLNPCLQYDVNHPSAQLRNISCLALKYNIVVVANLIDLQPCSTIVDSNCPSDGMYE